MNSAGPVHGCANHSKSLIRENVIARHDFVKADFALVENSHVAVTPRAYGLSEQYVTQGP
jgi:hypothetical protein